MRHLKKYFKEHPVIASIRNEEDLHQAIKSDVIAIVVMGGSILNLDNMVSKIKESDKLIFIHLDLVRGFARDIQAVQFLAINELCDGIISTKGQLVQEAIKEDLIGIQRLFLLDSDALKTGKNMLANNKPTALEVLPGIAAHYFLDRLNDEIKCPVIAGGLIRTKEEIDNLIAKGVFAISTGKKELWFK